jgi:anti-anti-sigma regulatory factor
MKPIDLTNNLDISDISELIQHTLIQMAASKKIVFNVGDVETISTSLLQFFISVIFTGKKEGVDVFFQNAQGNFLNLLKDFGCDQKFEGMLQ